MGMIINAVALAFILSIDEVITTALMSKHTKYMVSQLAPFPLFETADEDDDTELDVLEKHMKDTKWTLFSGRLWWSIFPTKMFGMVFLTAFFVAKYYREHCVRGQDGSWVANTVYTPRSDTMSFITFLFGPFPNLFPVETRQDSVAWAMMEMPDH